MEKNLSPLQSYNLEGNLEFNLEEYKTVCRECKNTIFHSGWKWFDFRRQLCWKCLSEEQKNTYCFLEDHSSCIEYHNENCSVLRNCPVYHGGPRTSITFKKNCMHHTNFICYKPQTLAHLAQREIVNRKIPLSEIGVYIYERLRSNVPWSETIPAKNCEFEK